MERELDRAEREIDRAERKAKEEKLNNEIQQLLNYGRESNRKLDRIVKHTVPEDSDDE